MTPSNPARYFVNPSEEEEFRYEPGDTPFYVIARKPHYIPVSVMVFAYNRGHVLEILEQLIEFRRFCLNKYVEFDTNHPTDYGFTHSSRHAQHLKLLEDALRGRKGYILDIGEAKTNQLYKIGWADNDTV